MSFNTIETDSHSNSNDNIDEGALTLLFGIGSSIVHRERQPHRRECSANVELDACVKICRSSSSTVRLNLIIILNLAKMKS